MRHYRFNIIASTFWRISHQGVSAFVVVKRSIAAERLELPELLPEMLPGEWVGAGVAANTGDLGSAKSCPSDNAATWALSAQVYSRHIECKIDHKLLDSLIEPAVSK